MIVSSPSYQKDLSSYRISQTEQPDKYVVLFFPVPPVKCLNSIRDYTTTAPFPKILQLSKQQSTQYSMSYTTTRKVISVVE